MSIRRTRLFKDVQDVLVSMLDSKTAAPWDRWKVIAGYPNETVFAVFAQPFIFVADPSIETKLYQQGASVKNYKLNVRIGSWVSLQNGGAEELAIMVSELLNFFDDPYTCNNLTFDTQIGNTTYTSKTIKQLGFSVIDVRLDRLVSYHEDSQLRQDVNITVITNLS
jgi:hypothetical protein